MKYKKILKIIAGLLVFITLPSLLFLGYLYFSENEDDSITLKVDPIRAVSLKDKDLDDGEHTVSVIGIDATGNQQVDATTFTFEVDAFFSIKLANFEAVPDENW